MHKTLLYRYGHIIFEMSSNGFMSYQNMNFTVSDSMNDFILTFTIEFSRKSYINTEIPRP